MAKLKSRVGILIDLDKALITDYRGLTEISRLIREPRRPPAE
jgi:hypothetical protein